MNDYMTSSAACHRLMAVFLVSLSLVSCSVPLIHTEITPPVFTAGNLIPEIRVEQDPLVLIPLPPQKQHEEGDFLAFDIIGQGLPHLLPRPRLQDIYFAYDMAVLRPEMLTLLEHTAAILRVEASSITVLEGHGDERGTQAYNLILGEKRARAVQEVLLDLGIRPDQLRRASMGSEQPACTEHTVQCWQRNRRVHFLRSYPPLTQQ